MVAKKAREHTSADHVSLGRHHGDATVSSALAGGDRRARGAAAVTLTAAPSELCVTTRSLYRPEVNAERILAPDSGKQKLLDLLFFRKEQTAEIGITHRITLSRY